MTDDETIPDPVTGLQFLQSFGVEDWRPIWGGAWACAFFPTASLAAGVTLVDRLGALATDGHAPDVDLRAQGVTVRLFTGRWGELSQRDVELARQISAAAHALGLRADPSRVQHIQVTIDVASFDAVRSFWCAVLGYAEAGEEDVFDPLRAGPAFSFQHLDQPRPQRNRIHIDVYLPHDQAIARV